MSFYLSEIFIHHPYVKSNFYISLKSALKNFNHLILTGKNGVGKTTILESLYLALVTHNRKIKVLNEFRKHVSENKPISEFEPSFHFDIPYIEFNYVRNNEKSKDFVLYFGVNRSLKNAIYTTPENQNKQNSETQNKETKLMSSKTLTLIAQRKALANEGSQRIELAKKLYDLLVDLNAAEIETSRKIKEMTTNIATLSRTHTERQVKYDIKQLRERLTTIGKEIEITKFKLFENQSLINIPSNEVAQLITDYLKERKLQQAYAIASNDIDKANDLHNWFENLLEKFRFLFENDFLDFSFSFDPYTDEQTFSFSSPGRKNFTFETLSHGYNSVFAIVAEILLQQDTYKAINKQKDDPEGIVLIDEIENHLHLSLQEKILPFLTGLFPRLQFIVSTHSPVILASLEDEVIYDLTSKTTSTENISGIPYDVLMTEHFGIESAYSIVATRKLAKLKELLKSPVNNLDEIHALSDELQEISPSLALKAYTILNEPTEGAE